MKSTAKQILYLFTAFFLFSVFAAQAQFNWPETGKKEAETAYALLNDNYKRDYKMALPYFLKLYRTVPNLNKSNYIQWVLQLIRINLQAEKDPKAQMALQDTILMLYDEGSKYFPDTKASNLNYKGYVAYSYLIRRPNADYKQIFSIYDEAYKENKEELFAYNAYLYMDVACRYKSTKGSTLTDEGILEIYDNITAAHAKNIKDGNDVENWNRYKGEVDKIVEQCVKIDCDFVKNTLGPKYNANPDLGQAKKIMTIMMSGKCTEDPLYEKVAKHILKEEPNYGLARSLAIDAKKERKYNEAMELFEQAASLTDDNSKKADAYMQIASMKANQGRKSEARSIALKAVGLDGSRTDAYRMIGDMYIGSHEECTGDNPVKARAIFIAAYDMYEKAGDNSRMKSAKAQFPSKEDGFTYGMKAGDSVPVGCWVGGTVSLKFR